MSAKMAANGIRTHALACRLGITALCWCNVHWCSLVGWSDTNTSIKISHAFFNFIRFRYSFICQGTSTRKQQRNLFGHRVCNLFEAASKLKSS